MTSWFEGSYNPSEDETAFTYGQNSSIYYPVDEGPESFHITGGTVKVSVSGTGDGAIYTIDIDCTLEADKLEDGDITGKVHGYVKGIYRGTLGWEGFSY